MMDKVPKALFNSKAIFNPYQYLPFEKILEFNQKNKKYEWNEKNLLITDEVGVGKTFEVGIILCEILRNKPNATVLICCPAKLCDNWVDELYENFFIPLTNYRKDKCFGQCTVLPYSYFSKKESDNSAEKESDNNIEKELIEDVDNASDSNFDLPEYDILILDEAHYIRNKGKLWKIIQSIVDKNEKEKKLKIFMTATPICNSE